MKKYMWFIIVFLLCFQYMFAKEWIVSQKTVATDRSLNDYYGCCVAISENVAIIGAYHDGQDTSGSNVMTSAGSAYICRFNGTIWQQEQKIVASDRKNGSNFGSSVDIQEVVAVVGAPSETYDANNINPLAGAGAVYIYRYNGHEWIEEQKIVANDRQSGDSFGNSVAISDDCLIIGAVGEDENTENDSTLSSSGSAYIFRYNGNSWVQEQKLVLDVRSENKNFGFCVDILGNTALIGSKSIGWVSETDEYLDTPGEAYVFTYNDTLWEQKQELTANGGNIGDGFGLSICMSDEFLFIGAPYANDGTGINKAGAVYAFKYNGNTWEQQQILFADDADIYDFFGRNIASTDSSLLIGVPSEDHDINGSQLMTNSGSAYFFTYTDSGWYQSQKVTSPARNAFDNFGNGVGISGHHALIAAVFDDEDENEENTISQAGATYFFNYSEPIIQEPEICVHSNDLEIINGDNTPSLTDNTDFGTAYIDSNAVVNTYTISNSGTGLLSLDTLYLYGCWGEVFSLSLPASKSIEPDSSIEFSISFAPVDTNIYMTTIYINSNDSDENPYIFSIKGKGRNKDVEDKIIAVSEEFFLAPAYPNPFNPKLVLTMINATGAHTVINIFNCRGECVDQVINGFISSGKHKLLWDASDMPSGIYLINMTAGSYSTTQKVALVK